MSRPPGRRLQTIDGDALSIALRCILKNREGHADAPAPRESSRTDATAEPAQATAPRPDTGLDPAPPKA